MQHDIKRRSALVETTSEISVNRYNAEIGSARKQIATHNAAIERHNTAVAAHKGKVDKFNNECAQKSYRDSDYSAVQAEIAETRAIMKAAEAKKAKAN